MKTFLTLYVLFITTNITRRSYKTQYIMFFTSGRDPDIYYGQIMVGEPNIDDERIYVRTSLFVSNDRSELMKVHRNQCTLYNNFMIIILCSICKKALLQIKKEILLSLLMRRIAWF